MTQTGTPLQIEAGKYYKTRDGRKVGPMETSHINPQWPWRGDGSDVTYANTGKHLHWGGEDEIDLIAEWTDTPKTWGDMTDAEKVSQEWTVCPYETWQQLDLDVYEAKQVVGSDMFIYRTKPEPVVEAVTAYGKGHGAMWEFRTHCHMAKLTHRLTFTTKDGEPATGTFRNDAGDVITMERIND